MGRETTNKRIIVAGKEIKPCPFCGKDEGVDICDQERGYSAFFIRCANCGAVGPPTDYLSDAIEAWNERHEVKDNILGLKKAGERGAFAGKNLSEKLKLFAYKLREAKKGIEK